jgi:hypothetical protein
MDGRKKTKKESGGSNEESGANEKNGERNDGGAKWLTEC